MKDIKKMTNGEFMKELVEEYSKYGALAQMVVLDCLQKGLDNYLENKEVILEQAAKDREEENLIREHGIMDCLL